MAMQSGREVGRAERFEDEKRRIVESCFNKKDDDGSSAPFPSPGLLSFVLSCPALPCYMLITSFPYSH